MVVSHKNQQWFPTIIKSGFPQNSTMVSHNNQEWFPTKINSLGNLFYLFCNAENSKGFVHSFTVAKNKNCCLNCEDLNIPVEPP